MNNPKALTAKPTIIHWNRLRVARKNLGWSLAKLARTGGVSINTVFVLETLGDQNTRPETKEKIAKALGVDIKNLFPLKMIGTMTEEDYLKKKIREDLKNGKLAS